MDWLSRGSLWSSSDLLLWGSIMVESVEPTSQLWDVRPVHVGSLLKSDAHEKEMFCITSVEFLMKSVKESFCRNVNDEVVVSSKFQFVAIRLIRWCRVLPCRHSPCSPCLPCPPLNFCLAVRWERHPSCWNSVCSVESCSPPSRIPVSPTIYVCHRVDHSVLSTIYDSGPWVLCGPSVDATTWMLGPGNCCIRDSSNPLSPGSVARPRRQFDFSGFLCSLPSAVKGVYCGIYNFIKVI